MDCHYIFWVVPSVRLHYHRRSLSLGPSSWRSIAANSKLHPPFPHNNYSHSREQRQDQQQLHTRDDVESPISEWSTLRNASRGIRSLSRKPSNAIPLFHHRLTSTSHPPTNSKLLPCLPSPLAPQQYSTQASKADPAAGATQPVHHHRNGQSHIHDPARDHCVSNASATRG